ncbi:MAG TPA: hypothetical protein VJR89_11605 [Polyangiales bacterium]|nr:hypothetical protein [Polyangiales bacterium]
MSKQRVSSWVLVCLVAALVCPARSEAKCKMGAALTPGDHMYSLEFGGKMRTFTLHVPSKYDGKTPLPLVFDLHGFSGTGTGQMMISGFKAASDANNFLVVGPQGYMNSWNGDIAFGSAYEAKLDDVGLMKEIVKFISGVANINHAKVFSTGLSNGAAMSNTLGCQAADTFAAVAPVADPLDIGIPTCKPAQPISVLGFHGYSDEYVPYEGGAGSGPRLPTPFPSIPDTLAAWGKIMGCTGMPEVMTFTGRNKCEIYRDCGGEAQVGYCSLEGGHVLYQQSAFNIADYAWKFFDKVSLPLPDADGDKIPDEDDNCVNVANPDQADKNGNCAGDACECSTPADCDDGKFCNGTESCEMGACQPGKPACADGQSCDESSRQCATGTAAAGAAAGGGAPAGSAGRAGTPASTAAGRPAAAGSAGGATSGAAGSTPAAAGASGTSPAATSSNAVTQEPPAATDSGGCGVSRTGQSGSVPATLLLLALAWIQLRAGRRRRRCGESEN